MGAMDLGTRIERRLKDMSMSQAELARRTGLKQPSINYLIRKGARGSAHLHQIARELQTSPAYLIGDTDDPSIDACDLAFSGEEIEWVRLLSALAPRDRDAVLHLARTIAASAVSPSLNEPKWEGPKR